MDVFQEKVYIFLKGYLSAKLFGLIIPTPHHYAYFEHFDWPKKMFYTSINSMNKSRNYFPSADY